MAEKTAHIVEAATRMFARYGYSKTTMGDIAAEAGVARQTVYNAFPGKVEILRAVVRHAGDTTYAQVMAVWDEADTVEAKLDAFHTLGPLTWFEAIRAAPDWAEMLDGMHKAASEEMLTQDANWQAALNAMLAEAFPDWPADAMPLNDIVEFYYSASLNAKHGADDIDHLKTRLYTIRVATLALLSR